MPKMRGFKPELWTDDKFVDLEPLARLLFMGMWTYACDNGHLDDKPKQIKMRVLPTDDVDPKRLIDQMVKLGMVVRSDGLLTIRKLREHQRIDDRYFTWCNRCESQEIPQKARERHAAVTSGTRGAHDVSTTGARSEPTLKEGMKEVKEGESEGSAACKTPKKSSAHSLPSSWEPTDAHWARRDDGIDVANEARKFVAHAEANDRRQVNWNAAFTQWLLSTRPTISGGTVHRLPSGESPDAWMMRRPPK